MATKKTTTTATTRASSNVSHSQLAGTDTLDRGNTNAKLDSLEPFRVFHDLWSNPQTNHCNPPPPTPLLPFRRFAIK